MSILTLSNELLLQISQYLNRQDDFYSLSLVCRHFHYNFFDEHLYIFNIKYRECRALFWGIDKGRISVVRRMLGLLGPDFDIDTKCPFDSYHRYFYMPPPQIRTGLHMASSSGHFEMVKLLLERGAIPTQPILYVALMSGHSEIARLLLERGADPLARTRHQSPLYPALIACDDEVVSMLTGQITNYHDYQVDSAQGFTPLHVACRHGRTKWVRYFLEHGADVDAKDVKGWTPLRFALGSGFMFFTRDTHNLKRPNYLQIFETIRILIEFGVNPELDIILGWDREGNRIHSTAANVGVRHMDPKIRALFRSDVSIPSMSVPAFNSQTAPVAEDVDNALRFTPYEIRYLQAAYHHQNKGTDVDIRVESHVATIWRPPREIYWPPSETDTVKAPENARELLDEQDVFMKLPNPGKAWVDEASDTSLVWHWNLRARKLAELRQ